jgi:hypothetical protein
MGSMSYYTLKYRDHPPHCEATAVKRTRGCRTTPALVTANFQILSVARLRKNTDPLSTCLTFAARRHMFCKCVHCANAASHNIDSTGQTLYRRQTSHVQFKRVRQYSTTAAFPALSRSSIRLKSWYSHARSAHLSRPPRFASDPDLVHPSLYSGTLGISSPYHICRRDRDLRAKRRSTT